MSSFPLIYCIGDTHFPWSSDRTIERIVDAIEAEKPDIIIQHGDVYDMYSWTRFPRTHCLLTPLQELKLGRKKAEMFWGRVKKASPRSKRYQLRGNHDMRPYKRIQERAPEFEPAMVAFDELFKFDGVETILDAREDLIIRDISFTHGFRKHGDHCMHTKRSTVVGHLHVGGVVYRRLGDEVIWELNCGWAGNPFAIPLSYTQLRRYNNSTQGFGRVDEAGPRFIHLPNPKYSR